MYDLTDEEKLFLGHLRLMENRTWAECVAAFEEKFGVLHDWRSLKDKLMAGNYTELMHKVYETDQKEAQRAFYEDLGGTELWLMIIADLFVNWKHLLDYSVKAHADTKIPEEERTFFWNERDEMRLRGMWEQLYSSTTQFSAHVRSMGPQSSDVKILQMFGPGSQNQQAIADGSVSLDATEGSEDMKSYVEQLILESQTKMKAIHADHRREGRGAFRAIPEALNDEQDDFF